MAAGGSGIRHEDAADVDLYGVLGLKKECSDADLRLAYRKLAMTWHPDRCSASGSSARLEEAKERFQEIQSAYSVLSDSGKRLLYDVGAYDSDEDGSHGEQDVSGMGDFLGDLAEMMSHATPTESFEELQQLFVDMFQADLVGGFGFDVPVPPPLVHRKRAQAQSPPYTYSTSGSTASPSSSCDGGVNKRRSSSMDFSGTPRKQEAASTGGAKKRRLSTSPSEKGNDPSGGSVREQPPPVTRSPVLAASP